MKTKFIDELGWIDKKEMLDMVAIAQAAPGAVAINSSVVVGYKTFGLIGALVAVIGTTLPPLLIISLVSIFYTWFKSNRIISLLLTGMQAGVVALLVKVVLDMAKSVLAKDKKFGLVIIFSVVIAGLIFKINVVYIILTLLVLGILNSFFMEGKDAF